ncbi:hypothetical protein OAX78_03705, partial [Planctomycetota bacterium]|nr:hypothetical protein [Planctomycetota bacterium]
MWSDARSRWIDALLVVVVVFVVHGWAGTFWAEFTFDDRILVESDQRLVVDGWDDVVTLATTKYWGDHYGAERLWRPLAQLTFAADRALLGPAPGGFHVMNVIYHAITCVLVLWLFRRLIPARRAALFGALIFAVHPVHAEAVVGIVGRSEVLALLLSTAGMLLHLRGRRRGSWWSYGGAAACFFAAITAKEIALTAPFIAAVIEIAVPASSDGRAVKQTWVERLLPYGLYVVALAGYFGCRYEVLGGLSPSVGAQTLGALSGGERVLVAAETTRDNFLATLLPQPTSAFYPFSRPDTSNWVLYGTVACHVAFVSLAGAAALLGKNAGARAIGLAVLGF